MAVQENEGGTENGRSILQIHGEGQQAHRADKQTPWSWKEGKDPLLSMAGKVFQENHLKAPSSLS